MKECVVLDSWSRHWIVPHEAPGIQHFPDRMEFRMVTRHGMVDLEMPCLLTSSATGVPTVLIPQSETGENVEYFPQAYLTTAGCRIHTQRGHTTITTPGGRTYVLEVYQGMSYFRRSSLIRLLRTLPDLIGAEPSLPYVFDSVVNDDFLTHIQSGRDPVRKVYAPRHAGGNPYNQRRWAARQLGITSPAAGEYSVGMDLLWGWRIPRTEIEVMEIYAPAVPLERRTFIFTVQPGDIQRNLYGLFLDVQGEFDRLRLTYLTFGTQLRFAAIPPEPPPLVIERWGRELEQALVGAHHFTVEAWTPTQIRIQGPLRDAIVQAVSLLDEWRSPMTERDLIVAINIFPDVSSAVPSSATSSANPVGSTMGINPSAAATAGPGNAAIPREDPSSAPSAASSATGHGAPAGGSLS